MALLWPGRCCSRRQGGCQQHRAEAQRRPKGQDAAGTPALPGDAVPAVRWGERKGSHTRHTLERVEPRRLYGCAGGGASGVGWPPTASAFAWRLGFCDSPREGSDWSVDGGREAGGAAVIRGMFRGGWGGSGTCGPELRRTGVRSHSHSGTSYRKPAPGIRRPAPKGYW